MFDCYGGWKREGGGGASDPRSNRRSESNFSVCRSVTSSYHNNTVAASWCVALELSDGWTPMAILSRAISISRQQHYYPLGLCSGRKDIQYEEGIDCGIGALRSRPPLFLSLVAFPLSVQVCTHSTTNQTFAQALFSDRYPKAPCRVLRWSNGQPHMLHDTFRSTYTYTPRYVVPVWLLFFI